MWLPIVDVCPGVFSMWCGQWISMAGTVRQSPSETRLELPIPKACSLCGVGGLDIPCSARIGNWEAGLSSYEVARPPARPPAPPPTPTLYQRRGASPPCSQVWAASGGSGGVRAAAAAEGFWVSQRGFFSLGPGPSATQTSVLDPSPGTRPPKDLEHRGSSGCLAKALGFPSLLHSSVTGRRDST